MKIEPGNKPRVPSSANTPAPRANTAAATPAESRKPTHTTAQDGFDDGPARSRPSASGPTVPQAALDQLGGADKARLQEMTRGNQGTDSRTNLGGVMGSPGFQRLNADEQAQALRTFLAAPPSSTTSAGHLTSLLGSAGFQSLSSSDKAQALEVFRDTSVDGRQHLVDLSHRTVNGRTALLDTDKNGHTLLSSLHGMATGPLEPALASNGVTRADLLCTVMQEAATPGQLDPHDHGTRTVTSMQYMLCQQNPAEYVRVMQGLTSPSGQVRLRNGDTLRRVPDSIAFDTATQRSSSERLFQAAVREHTTGLESMSIEDFKRHVRRCYLPN